MNAGQPKIKPSTMLGVVGTVLLAASVLVDHYAREFDELQADYDHSWTERLNLGRQIDLERARTQQLATENAELRLLGWAADEDPDCKCGEPNCPVHHAARTPEVEPLSEEQVSKLHKPLERGPGGKFLPRERGEEE